ncbi:MAG: hypothetical protein ACPL7R_07045 [Anaerolineae bacterium]
MRADTLQTTHALDNVVMAEYDIAAGTVVRVRRGEEEIAIAAADDVPFGCLLAIRDIPRGRPVIRAGVRVGIAAAHVRAGQRVDLR